MGTSLQDAQQIFTDTGLRTQYGVILPPGSRVAAYVRSTGVQSDDTAFQSTNLVTTLASGLARVRAGFGDAVVVLPGHVENVVDATMLSGLLAGTKIIGVGIGGNTPTFTWTATAASWNVAVNDVAIIGLRLLVDGINAVVNAINVTGADFQFLYNEIEVSTAAKAAAIVMTLGAGSNRFNISNNVVRGLIASPVTNGFLVSGSPTDARIADNEMWFPSNTANGNINITGTPLGIRILRNYVANTTAASVTALNMANVAMDGVVGDNRFYCKNTGAMVSGTNVITFGAAVLCAFDNNLCSNDPRTSGIVLPTIDT